MNQTELRLNSATCEIVIRNEDTFTLGSADNLRNFTKEYRLNHEDGYVVSQHSVEADCPDGSQSSCILMAGGGRTCVHEATALVRRNSLVIAVGDSICSLRLPDLDIEWKLKADLATCFGVYHSIRHALYISHGEIEIMGVSYFGDIVWSTGGKDIFTGNLEMEEDTLTVSDFNDEEYKIDIVTGRSKLLR